MNKDIKLSNCCNAPIKVHIAYEGTGCYVCEKCGKACDELNKLANEGQPLSTDRVLSKKDNNLDSKSENSLKDIKLSTDKECTCKCHEENHPNHISSNKPCRCVNFSGSHCCNKEKVLPAYRSDHCTDKPMKAKTNTQDKNWETEFEETFKENVKYQTYGSYVNLPALKSFINSLLLSKQREAYQRGKEHCAKKNIAHYVFNKLEKLLKIRERKVAQDILGMIGEDEKIRHRNPLHHNIAWIEKGWLSRGRNSLRQQLRTAISSKYKVKEGKDGVS